MFHSIFKIFLRALRTFINKSPSVLRGKNNMQKNKISKKQTKSALKFIFKYIARHKTSLIFGIILLIIVDFLQLIIPKFIQVVLDSISTENLIQKIIISNTIIILSLAVIMVVLRFFWRLFIVTTSRKIEKEIRNDVFIHLQKLSFSFYNKTKTGDLMALMINDLNSIRMIAGPVLTGATDSIFLGSMTIFFMFSINTTLALFSIIPLLCIAFFLVITGKKIRERFKNIQESFASISSFTQEIFSGIRIVKGFSQEEKEKTNFIKKSIDYSEKNLKLAKVWGMLFPLVRFVASISIIIYLFIGGIFTIKKIITLGQFVQFDFYISNLVWPMIAIGWVFNMFQQGLASTTRIMDLLNTKVEVFDNKTNKSIGNIKGRIEIKNLTFSYDKDKEPVINNLNLIIPENTTLGILGKHGSGKTTLISLLFRIFNVNDGAIFIDYNDINKIPINILRKSIGYVPQEMLLFSDTINNNILLGIDENKEDQFKDKIIDYSHIAALDREIKKFSNKYETLIGERGVMLSGGQKQRLSIARCLVLNPDILILDDAFSSVDVQTEQEIIKNMQKEIKKRTTIIIAHRISTIKDCDNIIVLENGKIKEEGTHNELLKNGDYYSRLYELQRLKEDRSSF